LKTIDILNANQLQLSAIAGELGFSSAEIEAITGYFGSWAETPQMPNWKPWLKPGVNTVA
jgi:hypothetical protein